MEDADVMGRIEGRIEARFEARRRRLELVFLAALAGGCGPDAIDRSEASAGTAEDADDEGINGVFDMPAGDPELCFAQVDAVGVGDCQGVFGWRWETGGCESVVGCSCEGTDCDSLYADGNECVDAHAHCNLCDPCLEPTACVSHCSGAGFVESVTCGGGCTDGEMRYSCPNEYNGHPVDADVECSGLGRVIAGPHWGDGPNDEPSSAAAARAWARISAFERASVAAFERLATQLETLDAPEPLIADARRSADDERRHAAVALAIARELDPASVPPKVTSEANTRAGLEGLLEETILAGCIGETLSALELEHMAETCRNSNTSARIREIAADEARHAEHAWELLGWLLRRFPGLRSLASRLLERPCETIELGLAQAIETHGLLADEQRARLWALGRARVVDPLARVGLAA